MLASNGKKNSVIIRDVQCVTRYSKKLLPFISLFVYGIPIIILNITRTLDGPYPFLRVYNQPIYMTIIWIIILFVVNYIIGVGLIKLNRKFGGNSENNIRESTR